MEIRPGSSSAQGATFDGHGTNFAVWSARASAVELCLFDAGAAREHTRLALPRCSEGIWHGYVPGLAPGQRYGYRIHGTYAPARGDRYNPHKLLLDPYARAIETRPRWHELLHGGSEAAPDTRDSAAVAPRCVVTSGAFDWQGDAPPRTAWRDTLIYECHVKGLTALHAEVPAELRGRYLGVASEPIIAHLQALGVTAVELLPVQQGYDERFLVERGLCNHWGYNTIGFFAPDVRFASAGTGQQVDEFKAMVRALHRAGIEVLLDVVYNHTGEAEAIGPTLCFRGVDNAAYYQLDPEDCRHYLDFTGCGNTVNLAHPQTLRLVADSLRYWVEEMHVDGFRFDLAPALARRGRAAPELDQGLFALIAQDPVLKDVKLIAEPWDVGPDSMQLGGFLPGFAEWNSRHRDAARRFMLRGDGGLTGELATRIAGSSDLFAGARRPPQASVSFVTCHDGFTLRDLCSYEQKHNDDNGWQSRDGDGNNHSRNFGVEGETDREDVLQQRERAARSLLGVLAFSLGTPMLQQGDELGRSQAGNNNPYNQDSEPFWVDWKLDAPGRELLEHTRRCFALRRELGLYRRVTHLQASDVQWLRAEGGALRDADWHAAERRALGMRVCGHDGDGNPDPAAGDTLLLLNGGDQSVSFALPRDAAVQAWRVRVDSADPARAGDAIAADAIRVAAGGLCLLQAVWRTA